MPRKTSPNPDMATLRLMTVGALVIASACAAPMLATETARSAHAHGADTPVHCGIAADSRGSMTTFRPWVRLDHGQSGQFSFALAGGGTVIDQGGDFAVGPDGQALLGEATVTGRASAYDAQLSVTVGGTRYRCHNAITDI